MKFLFGYKTDSLPLKEVTEHKGPWKWWGIAIGWSFFGFTKAENPKREKYNGGECNELLPRPKVVVLCGSSRFVDIMAVCAWIIERDENAITMGLHLLPRWYFQKEVVKDHLAEHENVREQMDTLHFRKIDLADEIFVVNYEDYIGESTTNEVKYAQKTGKNIRWFTHDEIGEKVKALLS
jgi:hypothetical protein